MVHQRAVFGDTFRMVHHLGAVPQGFGDRDRPGRWRCPSPLAGLVVRVHLSGYRYCASRWLEQPAPGEQGGVVRVKALLGEEFAYLGLVGAAHLSVKQMVNFDGELIIRVVGAGPGLIHGQAWLPQVELEGQFPVHQGTGLMIADQKVQLAQGHAIQAQWQVACQHAVAFASVDQSGDQILEVMAKPARTGLRRERFGGSCQRSRLPGALAKDRVGVVQAGGRPQQGRGVHQPA